MSDGDNVVRGRFGQPSDPNAPLIAFRPRALGIGRVPSCDHANVELDEHNHDLLCCACGVQVDPFLVLARMARWEGRVAHQRAELAAALKRIEELKAEERRIKDRLRRLEVAR